MKRNSSIELLRVISILLILFMHVSVNQPSNPQHLFGIVVVQELIEAVAQIGVTCFVLISGYYGLRFKPHRFVQLCLLTTLYCTAVCLVVNGGKLGVDVLESAFVIPRYGNWFISCYLITMLLSPFLNDFLEQLNKRRYLSLLVVLFFFLNVIPTLFNSAYKTVLMGGVNAYYIS